MSVIEDDTIASRYNFTAMDELDDRLLLSCDENTSKKSRNRSKLMSNGDKLQTDVNPSRT